MKYLTRDGRIIDTENLIDIGLSGNPYAPTVKQDPVELPEIPPAQTAPAPGTLAALVNSHEFWRADRTEQRSMLGRWQSEARMNIQSSPLSSAQKAQAMMAVETAVNAMFPVLERRYWEDKWVGGKAGTESGLGSVDSAQAWAWDKVGQNGRALDNLESATAHQQRAEQIKQEGLSPWALDAMRATANDIAYQNEYGNWFDQAKAQAKGIWRDPLQFTVEQGAAMAPQIAAAGVATGGAVLAAPAVGAGAASALGAGVAGAVGAISSAGEAAQSQYNANVAYLTQQNAELGLGKSTEQIQSEAANAALAFGGDDVLALAAGGLGGTVLGKTANAAVTPTVNRLAGRTLVKSEAPTSFLSTVGRTTGVALSEGVNEMGTTIAGNLNLDPNSKWYDGTAEAFVSGAAMGGALGGVGNTIGALTNGSNRPVAPPSQSAATSQSPLPPALPPAPVAQQPVAQQPAAKQPAAKQPAAQQPAAQQPAAQQPAAQQPAAQQPVGATPVEIPLGASSTQVSTQNQQQPIHTVQAEQVADTTPQNVPPPPPPPPPAPSVKQPTASEAPQTTPRAVSAKEKVAIREERRRHRDWMTRVQRSSTAFPKERGDAIRRVLDLVYNEGRRLNEDENLALTAVKKYRRDGDVTPQEADAARRVFGDVWAVEPERISIEEVQNEVSQGTNDQRDGSSTANGTNVLSGAEVAQGAADGRPEAGSVPTVTGYGHGRVRSVLPDTGETGDSPLDGGAGAADSATRGELTDSATDDRPVTVSDQEETSRNRVVDHGGSDSGRGEVYASSQGENSSERDTLVLLPKNGAGATVLNNSLSMLQTREPGERSRDIARAVIDSTQNSVALPYELSGDGESKGSALDLNPARMANGEVTPAIHPKVITKARDALYKSTGTDDPIRSAPVDAQRTHIGVRLIAARILERLQGGAEGRRISRTQPIISKLSQMARLAKEGHELGQTLTQAIDTLLNTGDVDMNSAAMVELANWATQAPPSFFIQYPVPMQNVIIQELRSEGVLPGDYAESGVASLAPSSAMAELKDAKIDALSEGVSSDDYSGAMAEIIHPAYINQVMDTYTAKKPNATRPPTADDVLSAILKSPLDELLDELTANGKISQEQRDWTNDLYDQWLNKARKKRVSKEVKAAVAQSGITGVVKHAVSFDGIIDYEGRQALRDGLASQIETHHTLALEAEAKRKLVSKKKAEKAKAEATPTEEAEATPTEEAEAPLSKGKKLPSKKKAEKAKAEAPLSKDKKLSSKKKAKPKVEATPPEEAEESTPDAPIGNVLASMTNILATSGQREAVMDTEGTVNAQEADEVANEASNDSESTNESEADTPAVAPDFDPEGKFTKVVGANRFLVDETLVDAVLDEGKAIDKQNLVRKVAVANAISEIQDKGLDAESAPNTVAMLRTIGGAMTDKQFKSLADALVADFGLPKELGKLARMVADGVDTDLLGDAYDAAKNTTYFKPEAVNKRIAANELQFSRREAEVTTPITSEEQLRAAMSPASAQTLDRRLALGREGKPGGVVFVQSANDIPGFMVNLIGDEAAPQGAYNPHTGITYIVGDNVTAQNVEGVYLHEAFHLYDRPQLEQLAYDIVDGDHDTSTPLGEFYAEVQERMAEAGVAGDVREAAPYMIELALERGRQEGFSAIDGRFMTWLEGVSPNLASLLRHAVARFRAWRLDAGSDFTPTVDDFVALARRSARNAATDPVTQSYAREGRNLVFSLGKRLRRGITVPAGNHHAFDSVARGVAPERVRPTILASVKAKGHLAYRKLVDRLAPLKTASEDLYNLLEGGEALKHRLMSELTHNYVDPMHKRAADVAKNLRKMAKRGEVDASFASIDAADVLAEVGKYATIKYASEANVARANYWTQAMGQIKQMQEEMVTENPVFSAWTADAWVEMTPDQQLAIENVLGSATVETFSADTTIEEIQNLLAPYVKKNKLANNVKELKQLRKEYKEFTKDLAAYNAYDADPNIDGDALQVQDEYRPIGGYTTAMAEKALTDIESLPHFPLYHEVYQDLMAFRRAVTQLGDDYGVYAEADILARDNLDSYVPTTGDPSKEAAMTLAQHYGVLRDDLFATLNEEVSFGIGMNNRNLFRRRHGRTSVPDGADKAIMDQMYLVLNQIATKPFKDRAVLMAVEAKSKAFADKLRDGTATLAEMQTFLHTQKYKDKDAKEQTSGPVALASTQEIEPPDATVVADKSHHGADQPIRHMFVIRGPDGATMRVPVSIIFTNEAVASAVRGIPRAQNELLEGLSSLSRFSQMWLTVYDGTFAMAAMMRDLVERTGALAANDTLRDANGNKVDVHFFKDTPTITRFIKDRLSFFTKSQRENNAVWQAAFNKRYLDNEDGAFLKEMLHHFRGSGLTTQAGVLNSAVNSRTPLNNRYEGKLRSAKTKVDEVLSSWSEFMGMQVGYALYRLLRERGVSVEDATVAVRNTFPQTRRGELTGVLRPFFFFFNSNIQGANVAAKSLLNDFKSAKAMAKSGAPARLVAKTGFLATKIYLSMMLGSIAWSALSGLLAGGDEDDEIVGNNYERENLSARMRNAHLPVPGGGFVKIPMGYGVGGLGWSAGQIIGSTIFGTLSPEEAMSELTKLHVKELSGAPLSDISFREDPINAMFRTITPSVFQGWLDFVSGTNRWGSPLGKTFLDPDLPKYMQGRDSTPSAYKAMAELIEPIFDATPEQIRALVSGLLPGIADRVAKGSDKFGDEAAMGALNISGLGRFYTAGNEHFVTAAYFNRRSQAEKLFRQVNEAVPRIPGQTETLDSIYHRALMAGLSPDDARLVMNNEATKRSMRRADSMQRQLLMKRFLWSSQ